MEQNGWTLKNNLINIGWAATGKTATVIVGFIFNMLLAKNFEVVVYGQFVLWISYIVFLTSLSHVGLKTVSNKLGNGSEKSIGHVLLNQLLYIIIISLVLILLNKFLKANYFWYGLGALWSYSFLEIFSELERGSMNLRNAVLYSPNLIVKSAVSIFIGVLIMFRINVLNEALYQFTLAVLIVASLRALYKYRRSFIIFKTIDVAMISQNFNVGMGAYLASLFFVLMSFFDLWLVGLLYDYEQVAYYQVALRFYAMTTIPLAIANSFLPAVFRQQYIEKNTRKLKQVFSKSRNISVLLSLLIFGIVNLFSRQLLILMFDDSYVHLAKLVSVMSVAGLITVLGGSVGLALNMCDSHWVNTKITVTVGVISFLLAFFGALYFGLMGLACSKVISFLILNYFLNRALGRLEI